MIYLRLFYEFFQTGLFTIGGGMASIPFLYALGDKTGWFSHAALADMIAVAESTPGPIGVNLSTYVGFQLAGCPGSVVATFAFVLPSVLIIILVSNFLARFRNSRYVDYAFFGLRAASAGLVAAAALSVLSVALLSGGWTFGTVLQHLRPRALLLLIFLFAVTNLKRTRNWHPGLFLGFSALVGILFHL